MGAGGAGTVSRPRFVELAARCPADLKLGSGGKGVLKEASRALLPAEIIDRTKGYFPVPGIRHLNGPILEMVRARLPMGGPQPGAVPSRGSRGLFDAPNEDPHHARQQYALAIGRAGNVVAEHGGLSGTVSPAA